MHDVSSDWYRIFREIGHQKEIKVTINGVEYAPEDDRLIRASISGKLFDAPSVGGAVSRTLELELVPWDGTRGKIPPMSEIKLFVRLVSADGTRKSEYIPKGVFYSDTAKRDRDTGAVTITAFDAMLKMERPFGVGVCRITFDDLLGGIQRYVREIGDAMPTPDTPTHTGERFAAWSPNPSDTPTVVRDMLFTAQWERKYTVTFDSGDGTPQVFACFEGDATPTPPIPTKAGYTFAGWAPTPTPTVTADATYTAQWAFAEYEITPPIKTAYSVGETLDYTGLVVTRRSSDGTSADVTADCVLSPADGTLVETSGTITVTASYEGEMATFELIAREGQIIDAGGWWALYDDGLLVVFCDGDMPDYEDIYDEDRYSDYVNKYGNGWEPVTSAPWDYYIHTIYDAPPFVPIRPALLTMASICQGVTSIGNFAFAYIHYGGQVWNLKIPDSVTKIGDYAFYYSHLSSVVIPSSVTEIGEYAFRATGVNSVTISRDCKVGYNAFDTDCVINYYQEGVSS